MEPAKVISSSESAYAFFRAFQDEVASIQRRMERLDDVAAVGAAVRGEVVEECLTRMSRLSDSVKDASVYLPAHDQRTYAEAIKQLRDQLDQKRTSLLPRPRFAFKNTRENRLRTSQATSNTQTLPQQEHAPEIRADRPESATSKTFGDEIIERDDKSQNSAVNHNEKLEADEAISNSALSESSRIVIRNRILEVVTLPESGSGASVTLEGLQHCIVDNSAATATEVNSLSGLVLKDIAASLLMCGQISGPAHVTGVVGSIVVATCRQFRMHACRNCDVYLHVTSRPIVEDCSGIRFAPIPNSLIVPSEKTKDNKWDKVDDFRWLKAQASPNWAILPEQDRIFEDVWIQSIDRQAIQDPNVVLRQFGIQEKP